MGGAIPQWAPGRNSPGAGRPRLAASAVATTDYYDPAALAPETGPVHVYFRFDGEAPEGTVRLLVDGSPGAEFSLRSQVGPDEVVASFSAPAHARVVYQVEYESPDGPVTEEIPLPWYQNEQGGWGVMATANVQTPEGLAPAEVRLYLWPWADRLDVADVVLGSGSSPSVTVRPLDWTEAELFLPPATAVTVVLGDPTGSYSLESPTTAGVDSLSSSLGDLKAGRVGVVVDVQDPGGATATIAVRLVHQPHVAGTASVSHSDYGPPSCPRPGACFVNDEPVGGAGVSGDPGILDIGPFNPDFVVYTRGYIDVYPIELAHEDGASVSASVTVTVHRGEEEGGGVRWVHTVPIGSSDFHEPGGRYDTDPEALHPEYRVTGVHYENWAPADFGVYVAPAPSVKRRLGIAEPGDHVTVRFSTDTGLPDGWAHTDYDPYTVVETPEYLKALSGLRLPRAPLTAAPPRAYQATFRGGPEGLAYDPYDGVYRRYSAWSAIAGISMDDADPFIAISVPPAAAGDTVVVSVTAADPSWRHDASLVLDVHHVRGYDGAPSFGRPPGHFVRLDTGESGLVDVGSVEIEAPYKVFARGDVAYVAVPPDSFRTHSGQTIAFAGPPLPRGTYTMRFAGVARTFRDGVDYHFRWDTDEAEADIGVRPVEVELLSASEGGTVPTESLRIGLWDGAYTPDNEVYNEAGEASNFVDRDPDRFYVRVTDPTANRSATEVDVVTSTIGADSPEGSDDPTPIVLTETGVDTGVFESPSQLLVTRDHPVPSEGSTPLRYTDDNYPVHDGTSGPVADDETGDRTHWAGVGGTVTVTYGSVEATAPVCGASATVLNYRVLSMLEPYQDVGYVDPVTLDIVGADDGQFSYQGAESGSPHEAGTPSEPYADLSFAFLFNPDRNDIVAIAIPFLPGDQQLGDGPSTARGPVYPDAVARAFVDRADLSWEQACVRFSDRGLSYVEPPLDDDGTSVFSDGSFDSATDTELVYEAIRPALALDEVAIVFAPSIRRPESSGYGGTAFAIAPYPGRAAVGEFDLSRVNGGGHFYTVVGAMANYRTLPHELGHLLALEPGHTERAPALFFPTGAGGLPPGLRTIGDYQVNLLRRIRPALVERAHANTQLFGPQR